MKNFLLLAGCAPLLVACASGPVTAWGKENVSMEDYRAELTACALISSGKKVEESASNTAGGISGKNSSGPGTPSVATGQGTGEASGAAQPTGGGGSYRESASPDFVARAAQQQRAQEMAQQRAKAEALKSCLVKRGYSEFRLTEEQRQHLAKLPQGSDERREYLYKLGSDPNVLNAGRVTN